MTRTRLWATVAVAALAGVALGLGLHFALNISFLWSVLAALGLVIVAGLVAQTVAILTRSEKLQ